MTTFIGKKILTFFTELGQYFYMMTGVLKSLGRLFRDRKLVFEQMQHVGVNSLVLVAIIGIFTGAVSCWQAAYQIKGLISYSYLGSAVTKAILIELGPVLAAIVLAGRVGASMAAELGTMKVTEQIDALESMAIDPIRYLAMPRIVATTIMLPVLVVYASSIAIMGAFTVATVFLGVPSDVFLGAFKKSFELKDFYAGTIKAIFFGLSISSIGCFIGFSASGGAEGVGLATIKAFVIAAASILMLDYILWNFLIGM
ncbi:MAG TPA: ABC transporter permease [Ignavibacteria bacterium]|nr:ABC transporter permease [Ignavibacteria bacterium]HRK00135.1 ABC transporter permease [Ignavibacteria bacterium]